MLVVNRSDYILIRLIQQGDREAFGALFNQYYAPLCSYAVTILKLSETAEDVVQETFIRLWEARESFSIEVSIRAYLYRSVHNNCISYIRNKEVISRRNKKVSDEIVYHAELATCNMDGAALESMISGELEEFFEKTILSLPEQCSRIFRLCRYDHLSYQEIAEKLGISVNTVKTQLSRAFYKLRDAYGKFENN
jgi:RNA polymerase sigma-70 factor (ECF subfamily)